MKQIRRYAAVLVASTGLIPPVSGHTIPAAVSAAARIATCPASVPTGDHRGKLVVDKLSRTYLLHIPPHIRAGHRYPLVIMLHPGYEYLAPPVPEVTHMSTVADRHGFVVVYPDGVNGQWHTDAPDDKPVQGPQNDVRIMSRLIDALGTRVCLDLQRVYASGQSSGGTMANRLACDLSARIAAIAPVYGTYTYTRCAPTHPVSLIAFHGTGPDVTPYHGGGAYGAPDIPTWARGWAHRDGCLKGPTRFSKGSHFTAVRYTACRAGSEVQLYTMLGEGDEWPADSDLLNQTNNASELIWHFFAAHPRR